MDCQYCGRIATSSESYPGYCKYCGARLPETSPHSSINKKKAIEDFYEQEPASYSPSTTESDSVSFSISPSKSMSPSATPSPSEEITDYIENIVYPPKDISVQHILKKLWRKIK